MQLCITLGSRSPTGRCNFVVVRPIEKHWESRHSIHNPQSWHDMRCSILSKFFDCLFLMCHENSFKHSSVYQHTCQSDCTREWNCNLCIFHRSKQHDGGLFLIINMVLIISKLLTPNVLQWFGMWPHFADWIKCCMMTQAGGISHRGQRIGMTLKRI